MEKYTQKITECINVTIEIKKRGDNTMNCDEGQYTLTHNFDEDGLWIQGLRLSGGGRSIPETPEDL